MNHADVLNMLDKLAAVVSPTGKIHAVPRRSEVTACGLKFRHRPFTAGYASTRWWVAMATGFDELNVRREGNAICTDCLENLTAGAAL